MAGGVKSLSADSSVRMLVRPVFRWQHPGCDEGPGPTSGLGSCTPEFLIDERSMATLYWIVTSLGV